MAFITDKEELKPGLIIFRRADVAHRNWYCRMKLPKADRYKTVSLKTSDITDARERAYEQDAEIRFQLKHDIPVFNRPFSQVGNEYLAEQERALRATMRGEAAHADWHGSKPLCMSCVACHNDVPFDLPTHGRKGQSGAL